MKHLREGAPQVARQYLEKALDLYDRSPLLWSNMGVIEKYLDQYEAAERAYLTALEYDDEFLSAIKNLYVLYMHTEETEKAARYAEIVEEYSRRNPYYLEKLAKRALDKGEHKAAIDLLKEAIDIKEDEDRFHFALAKAYYFSGDLRRATQAMEDAREVAASPRDRARYRNKLAALESIVRR